ncbi:23S ribosomal RNA methyltransferase Erm [Okibacterium endophyticum]
MRAHQHVQKNIQHSVRSHGPGSASAPVGGRHENGQNFLVDRRLARDIADIAAGWHPRDRVVEFGSGDGAITQHLVSRRLTTTAVEIDPRCVWRLRDRFGDRLTVVQGDMLEYRFAGAANIVSNVPYHLTTPLLKKLLAERAWSHALLLVQWEVARKRAAVGGTTLMTVQWWPWYDFTLLRRVPASGFRPVPSVDSGLLQIDRRVTSLLPWRERGRYQRLVAAVFTAKGRGVRAMASNVVGARTAAEWAAANRVAGDVLPKHLDAGAWVDLATRARR